MYFIIKSRSSFDVPFEYVREKMKKDFVYFIEFGEKSFSHMSMCFHFESISTSIDDLQHFSSFYFFLSLFRTCADPTWNIQLKAHIYYFTSDSWCFLLFFFQFSIFLHLVSIHKNSLCSKLDALNVCELQVFTHTTNHQRNTHQY